VVEEDLGLELESISSSSVKVYVVSHRYRFDFSYAFFEGKNLANAVNITKATQSRARIWNASTSLVITMEKAIVRSINAHMESIMPLYI
jgi:hypothetical protein